MTTKDDLIARYDPDATGPSPSLFGLPFSLALADIIIIPLPWEVTVSYNSGTVNAPQAILKASTQVDLYQHGLEGVWKRGMAMLPIPDGVLEENTRLRVLAQQHIKSIQTGMLLSDSFLLPQVNQVCEGFNLYVQTLTRKWMKEGKLIALVGGDHSTPLGYLRALAERNTEFGILQIDAHADLRKAYQGFTYSHGSIMYNALKLSAVTRLVQVGVRDCSEEEVRTIQQSNGRIVTYFDDLLKEQLYEGQTWENLCDGIIEHLPPLVYLSVDIDGLDPKLCPHTGTPVPGGLEMQQVVYLVQRLVNAGKRIIGLDLCEVGHGEWDANVGARLLYKLCGWMSQSALNKH